MRNVRQSNPGIREGRVIKILFVTASYLPESVGGTQLHIKALADALKSGHEVAVLARTCKPEAEEYSLHSYDHDGIPVHTINNTFREARDFSFLYSVEGVNRAMEAVLDDFRPDLVHVHHLTCLSTDFLDLVRQRGIPAVMTLHDFWMVCPRGQRLHRDGTLCESLDRRRCLGCIRGTWDFLSTETESLAAWDDHVRRRLNGLDRILVPSRFYKSAFTEYGLDPKRMIVLPHGLDTAPFHGVEAARVRGEKTRIGYLGTVIPSKGVHVLLEAARRLRDQGHGHRITVEIHGEVVAYHDDAGYPDRLKAAVPDGVEVRFHGRYEFHEAPRILRNIDILVVPSVWWEAFGLTVREGFLAGVVVVASNAGALGEALADGRGLLFTPGDAGDLGRQLARLLEDPGLARSSRGRREWVRTHEEMAAETLAVYEAVTAKKRGAPPPPRLGPRGLGG